MEAAKPEWAQRRKAKKEWKELFMQRTRHGLFTFVKHKKRTLYGIGFSGGTHRAFMLFTERMLPVLEEVNRNLRRESKKNSMKKHTNSI
jgi:inhibitor of KinA sporulation pathway (predicted exonuclease)